MNKTCAVIASNILLSLLVWSFDASAQLSRPTSFDKRPACETENGSWRQFGNACADSCKAKFDKFSICAQSLTYACDCGDNKCWNGKYCVGLEDYERVYQSVQEKKQKKLDEKKEQRKPLARSNRNLILKRIIAQNSPLPKKNSKNKNNTEEEEVDQIKEVIAPKTIDNKNNAVTQVQIPPYFLKKQAQQAALKKANEEFINGSVPDITGLSDVPLP